MTLIGSAPLWALQVALFLALTLVVHALLRRRSATTRHLVLAAGIAVAVGWPLWSSLVPALVPAPAAEVSAAVPAWDATADGATTMAPSTVGEGSPAGAIPVAANWSVPVVPGSAVGGLLLLWLAGTLVLLARLVVGNLRAAVLVRRAIDAVPDRWAAALASVVPAGRAPTLRATARLEVPAAFGFGGGVILVPTAGSDWSPDDCAAALRHELAHLERRDHLVQLMAGVLVALHWFNPLAWRVAALAHAERERACDDAVLSSGMVPSAYAGLLLRVATLRSPRGVALAALAGRPGLEGRLLSLLDAARPRQGLHGVRGVIAVLVPVLVLATPLAGFRQAAPDALATLRGTWQVVPGDCPEFLGRRDLDRHCLVREFALPAGPIAIDSIQNGAVEVRTWDGREVAVRVWVDAQATHPDSARLLAESVVPSAEHRLVPRLPEPSREAWVAVHLQLLVPRGTDLDVTTHNAPVRISGALGRAGLRSINGHLLVRGAAGEVAGTTINGRVGLVLDDTAWTGGTLRLETTNGAVRIEVPTRGTAGLLVRTERGVVDRDIRGGRVVECEAECSGRGVLFPTRDGSTPTAELSTFHGDVVVRGGAQ